MNSCNFIGRLTKDVEVRYTNTQKPVVAFTLAVDRGGKDKGADFINCVAWDGTALVMEKYLAKGSQVGIEGSLHMRQYTDKDGNKRTAAEITVNRMHFCGSNKKESGFASLAGDNPFLDDIPM